MPEVVPFRLTHNMVQAMVSTSYTHYFTYNIHVQYMLIWASKYVSVSMSNGCRVLLHGYEGVFRNSCERIMCVIREQRDPPMWCVSLFVEPCALTALTCATTCAFLWGRLHEGVECANC